MNTGGKGYEEIIPKSKNPERKMTSEEKKFIN